MKHSSLEHGFALPYVLGGFVLALLAGAGTLIFSEGIFGPKTPDVAPPTQLSMNLTLPDLSTGHYEAWIVFDEEKVSAGKFKKAGPVNVRVTRELTLASGIMITIESETDNNGIPSGIVVLTGDVEGNVAELQFPMDFTMASGTYLIATPTNGPDSDETSGIWFVDVSSGEPLPGLTLPNPATGWKYESWLKIEDTFIPFGKFSATNEADTESIYSGTEPAPTVPGEDFLNNPPSGLIFPLDLTTGSSTVIISVEPELGGQDPTGKEIFIAQPLFADIPAETEDNTNLPLTLDLMSLPVGTVILN